MKVRFDKHVKLKGKTSLFVKCNYNDPCLELIHSFGRSYYHKEFKMWELPPESFPLLMAECNYVLICGEVIPKYRKFMELLDLYDEPNCDYKSKTIPFSHQTDSFNYSKEKRSFLLGDEQGLGKTKQALDIAVSRKHKFKHCLIVCGVNGLKYNWLKEVEVHTDEKGHILGMNDKGKIGNVKYRLKDLLEHHEEFFIITNIETLRDKDIGREIQNMCECGLIGMTIIDEIHKAKNYSSSQGSGIHYCNSYYKLAMTGTPLMNSPMDLYNILKWLGYENHSYTQFENRYAIKGGYGNYQIVGYKHLDELQEILDKHMLRRKKQDVLDLPDKIYVDDILEMDTGQTKIYNEVLENLQNDIDKILLDPNPLSQLTRLRQATSCPEQLTTKKVSNIKLERVLDIVEDAEDKVIVFSNYTSSIYPMVEKLKKFNPAVVTGEEKHIDEEIEKFHNDSTCKVVLGTIGCLGTGYTLTEATTVIFVDLPWNMANKLQAEDRAHRIGTTKPVTIYNLMCHGTIDEKINKIVNDKGAMSDFLVDQTLKEEDIQYLLS